MCPGMSSPFFHLEPNRATESRHTFESLRFTADSD